MKGVQKGGMLQGGQEVDVLCFLRSHIMVSFRISQFP
jgi:hypothetical protein